MTVEELKKRLGDRGVIAISKSNGDPVKELSNPVALLRALEGNYNVAELALDYFLEHGQIDTPFIWWELGDAVTHTERRD